MKQEKQKQTEKKEVSIAPINITNKFIDVNNVVQAPLFRVLARGQERKQNVKLYSYQKTYDIKEKKEIDLHWRFDISEELSIFDFKMYLYLINKYIQKDLTKFIDLKELGPGDDVIVDYLNISSDAVVCTVLLRTIAKDLGYIKPNNEDKQRILDSLIRLQKVFVFFSEFLCGLYSLGLMLQIFFSIVEITPQFKHFFNIFYFLSCFLSPFVQFIFILRF